MSIAKMHLCLALYPGESLERAVAVGALESQVKVRAGLGA